MLVDFEKLYYEYKKMLEVSGSLYTHARNMNYEYQNILHDMMDLLDAKNLKIIDLKKQLDEKIGK